MSGTASRLARRLGPATHGAAWIDVTWVVFSLACLGTMLFVPGGETVPFHFVWVSFTLVYGIRLWRLRTTAILLAWVMLMTGIALGIALIESGAGWDEMTEVPLMAAMFAAVMWHVERRQAALDEVRRLAESEHRLRERERNLVRDASHELRTPITVARGHAELIRKTSSGQAGEDAEVILDELGRLSRIADRLLILAAVEHPDFLRRTPVELERLIVDTAKRWSATVPRQWRVGAVPDGVLYADEERLHSTLDALIENAIKFTREDDRIAIVARAVEGTAIIEVTDTGDGIPQEQLSRVFDRFSRVDEGRPRGNGGTGLGLAIVKAIIEAHGGSVAVTSQLGKGTTFALSVPGFRRNVLAAEPSRPAGPLGGEAQE